MRAGARHAAGGPQIRVATVVTLLLLSPLVTASGLACSRVDHEACVAFEHMFFSYWDEKDPYGGFVLADAASWTAFWYAHVHEWPQPAPPAVDFDGSFVLVHVGLPGGLATTQVQDVASTGPGEYVVTYASTWLPQPDVEWRSVPVHAVAVAREAGAPASVTWVGWQTAPDGTPLV
jgi:hypothetical protein